MKKLNKFMLCSFVAVLSSLSSTNLIFAKGALKNDVAITKTSKVEEHKHIPFTTTKEDDYFAFPETADKYGQPELTYQVRDIMIPNIVDDILKAFPAFQYLDKSSIAFGLSFINDPSAHFSARMSGGPQYSILPGSNKPTDYRMSNGLQINLSHYNTGWKPNLGFNDKEGFERILVHEMMHAFTMEALPRGWSGIDKDGDFAREEQFPTWFSEGVADAVAGEMSHSLKLGALDKDAPDYLVELILKKLPESNTQAVHGVGYYASLYLGQIMSGEEDFSAKNIRNGLNTLFESLISGVSFDDTLKNYTKFNSLDDFEKKLPKEKEAYDFVRWVLSERNYNRQNANSTGFGGILKDDLNAKDLISDQAPATINPLFKMDSSRSLVSNQYPKEVTILSGGSKNQPGTKPVKTYSDPLKPVTLDVPNNITYRLNYKGEVTVSWDSVENADSYSIELYRYKTKKDQVTLKNTTQYTFKTMTFDTNDYTFKIKAVGDNSKFRSSDKISYKGFPPVINGAKNITLRVGDKFNPLKNVTSTDKEDRKISNIKVTGTVDTSKVGTYPLLYSVTDRDGNVISAHRTVTVKN